MNTKAPTNFLLEPRVSVGKIFFDCLIIFCLAKLMLVYEWSQVVNTGLSFVGSVMRGDSWWFKNIVEHGYMHQVLVGDPIRNGQANWAFFPLFPLITKVVTLLGFSSSIAAIIVNQLFLFLALVVGYKIGLLSFSRSIALIIPLAIAVSPANIWFMAAYSDMSYLFISMLAFYCLQRQSYWWFVFLGFLLALTRFTGFLLIVPLVISYWRNHNLLTDKKWRWLLLQIMLIISGLGVFMLVLYLTMGDPLAFYHIQSAWGHLGTSWFKEPLQSWLSTWHSGVGHDRLFLALVPLWLAVLLWDKYYEEAAFALVCLLAPLAAGSLWSYSRYVLGVYPLYLAIALIARKSYLLGLMLLLLAAFISAGYWTTWLNDGWV